MSLDLKVIEEPKSYQVLLDPLVVGKQLRDRTRESMVEILSHMKEPDNPLEFAIHTGGPYYQLQDAYYKVFGRDLPRISVGAKRHNKNGTWEADVSYKNFEALKDGPTLLVADTVATGSSMVATLEYLLKYFESRGYSFEELIMPGFAVAKKGAERIAGFCDERGIRTKFIIGGGLVGLAENGTDMPIIHPYSDVCEGLKTAARETYGELAGEICCIFDWGKRNQAFRQHFMEVAEKMEGFMKKYPGSEYARKTYSAAKALASQ